MSIDECVEALKDHHWSIVHFKAVYIVYIFTKESRFIETHQHDNPLDALGEAVVLSTLKPR